MRIISGQYGGRIIQSVPSKQTRPTTDRVREAWASSIVSLYSASSFEDACVLDAFAGSGALGLELLSRGASSCIFTEHNKSALKILRSNIASLEISPSRAQVKLIDCFNPQYAESLDNASAFTILVLDPPYRVPSTEVGAFIGKLYKAGRIEKGCLVSYEHAAENQEELETESASGDSELCLTLLKRKKYGTICLDFYHCS